MKKRVPLTTFVLLGMISSAALLAEIPKKSQAELHESASHTFTGTVARTYQRQQRTSKQFEHTFGVAEILVDRVDKGAEISGGDRVFVRYWRKKWIGGGNPPPDHYGHWQVPGEADTVVVYVKGDRKSGFDVLSPNGFFEVTKADAEKADTDR